MNKIILFLVIIIIGTALSTGMGDAHPKKISNSDFDCTLKAIKVCGSDDSASTNRCLRKYMRRCEKNPPSHTQNISGHRDGDHKNHHPYKTTIIVKHKHDAERKRICITGSNNSRKCYRMDCQDAGVSRCNEKVDIRCGLKFPDSPVDKQNCVEQRLASCLRHEKATCRRAIRVNGFRKVCEAEAQTTCNGIADEDEKCKCVGTTRHSCLLKKVDTYRRNVRKFYGCEEGSKIICSQKCGSEEKQCIEQETTVCEPVCQRESRLKCNNQLNGPCYKDAFKTCITKWKSNYCEKRAHIKCGNNQDCLDRKLQACRGNLPGCMTGDVSCNDNNKCTKDICDPVKGCINQPLNCDDNNACTTESCDPVLGCVYKTKNCDDGLQCTKDSCNPATGECVHTFDKNICHVCSGGPCKVDSDCNAFSHSRDLASKCQVAYCDAKTGSCLTKKKKHCAEECRSNCLPFHACDNAHCVLNKDSQEFECVHSRKSCDDHKSCTIDTCDNRVGCVHTLDKENCPNHPICDSNADCQKWATTHNFDNKCKKAICDHKKGICIASVSTKECFLSECQKNCQPRSSCENVKCVLSDDGEKAHCARTPVICDDKKACTVDKCDPVLGCVFKYTVNHVCQPGCQCTHNADCQEYEKINKLEQQCLKAICDEGLGACVKVPASKECRIKRRECKDDCVAIDACDVAKCVKSGDELVCKHTPKSCDDGIECTKDTCDAVQGCVHTYTVSEKCKPDSQCTKDSHCLRWGFSQKLGKKCQKAICDKKLGSCVAIPKERDCITFGQCSVDCAAKNICETAHCELNNSGDYVCKRITKNICDDGDPCTFDACEPLTGGCSHVPISSPKCKVPPPPPPKDDCVNCKPRNACETARCVDRTCKYGNKNCDDGKECTLDSCDNERGCVHTYIQSKRCPPEAQCKVTEDCANYSKIHKCKSRCLIAVCDDKLGRCVTKPSTDTTCVPKDECLECKPKNACESAVCEKDLESVVTCKRTENKCNDGKECTKDSCDTTTGKCTNTYTVSPNCPPGGQCAKNLDCQAWALKQGHDLKCLTPVCDSQLGACKVVPNGKKCKSRTCKKACPTSDACQDSTCAYDTVTKQLVCQFERKICDDKNKCTRDSCDKTTGCVFTFDKTITGCDTPICKEKTDCAKWAVDNNLADQCQDAICDDSTKTCRAVLINNKNCNPCLKQCKKNCQPAHACETTECIADPTTQKCNCVRKTLSCDDKNDCTTDVCDKVKGCVFTYTKNEGKCTEYCRNDVDCADYAVKHQCDLECKIAVCDKDSTSCKIVDNPDKSCVPIKKECDLVCKARNSCETAKCVRKRKNVNQYKCVYSPVVCNDNKKCTVDTCDKVKGCQFTFKTDKDTCIKQCEKDLDCATIEVSEKLAKRCLKAVCDKETGSCKRIKGPDREDCGDQCNLTSDCPQGKFGTVCCIKSGKKSCCDNDCETDLDCKCKEGQWGYCTKEDNGRKRCHCKDKCKKNEDCDDKNPCTRDVCLKEYGFCKNLPRCVDNSLCTLDICIPSSDLKSYTCKNPTRCCTQDKNLLDKDFDTLSPSDKTKWLGLCSHTEGCKHCVVSAQCDDNNGCTKDDCINQFCISTPIDNKWCDPKIEGQAITVQAYFPKFQRL